MKLIKKLFGRKAIRSKKNLVQVVTADGVEHYRYAKLPLKMDVGMFSTVSNGEGLDFLSEQGFDQIDMIAPKTFCVYSAADDYRAHNIYSVFPLDIFCEKMTPVFRDDTATLTDVVSIKKIECETFCYNGRLYDFNEKNEMPVSHHHNY